MEKKNFLKASFLTKRRNINKILLYFYIIFRFLEASKIFIKLKYLSLKSLSSSFVFSIFFFSGQRVNKTVLIKSIRKGDK